VSKRRAALRGEMRRIVTNLDPRWIEAASHDVSKTLTQLLDARLGDSIEHVLVWEAFFPGEVDLSSFVLTQYGRRSVYMPRTLPDHAMQFIAVDPGWRERAERSVYGIPEPREGDGAVYDTRLAAQTLIVVPGLAFDRMGNRLGRGGGYYDRFLGRSSLQSAVKVGVCWGLQIVDVVPTEPHDVGMDWVCFERGCFDCSVRESEG